MNPELYRVSRGRYSGGVHAAKVYTGRIIFENVRNQLYLFSMKSLLLPTEKKNLPLFFKI